MDFGNAAAVADLGGRLGFWMVGVPGEGIIGSGSPVQHD